MIGFFEVIEIALMISLLQTESLTSNPDQTLCHVVHRLPAHREVGEGGEAQGEISPVEMAFRRGLVDRYFHCTFSRVGNVATVGLQGKC